MENRRAIIISIVLFGISMILVTSYVSVKRHEMTKTFGDEVKVVVAKQDIAEFGIIKPEMVEVISIFKNFRQPQTVSDEADVVGKAAYVPIAAGEQVTLTKLIHPSGKPVLDRQVEKKMRAVTLLISPHSGVGRLIRPGNHVDIIAVPSYDSNGTNVFEVKTVVQNVLVLATGKSIQNAVPSRVNRDVLSAIELEAEKQRRKDLFSPGTENLVTSRPDDNYAHITVQLTPEDAEKVFYLTHAYGDKAIYFTLRNGSDVESPKLTTTLLDNVLGPDSDYGRSRKKPKQFDSGAGKRFDDIVGGQAVPVY